MLRHYLLAATSFAALVLTAGQSPAQARPACGSGKPVTVNLLYPTQPQSLDGNYSTLVVDNEINRNLYDGLFKLNDDMKVVPDLALSYTQPDSLSYDIKLREGVKFQDGSPFTSADVVSTFDRIQHDTKLASKQKFYVSNIASVEAKGDYEVLFKLKEADATFPRVLANIIFITPKSVIDKVGDLVFGKHPVGTGPFKFESWSGGNVVLKANCDYWGPKPIPSKVTFRFISEPATQISALQSGEIDIATYVTPDLATGLMGSPNVRVEAAPGNTAQFLSYNTLKGPFKDVRVRQAVNYAIDKNAIAKQLYGGFAKPLGQVYGPGIFGYSPDVTPYPYDPAKAKALLKQAGFDSNHPLNIELVNQWTDVKPVWQTIAAYFRNVGIKVTTREDPNFFGDVWLKRTMKPDQVLLMHNQDILMDADFVQALELDGTRRGLYFHTPETDALIAKARGLADEKARLATYEQLNKLEYKDAVMGFLFVADQLYGVSKNIDWKPRPDASIYLADVNKK